MVSLSPHPHREILTLIWIDTLEVQEVVLGVNLVELEVQFYHQTRVGMNVAAGRVAHTRKETVIVSVSSLGIDKLCSKFYQ
jgi:hypothetical protein